MQKIFVENVAHARMLNSTRVLWHEAAKL